VVEERVLEVEEVAISVVVSALGSVVVDLGAEVLCSVTGAEVLEYAVEVVLVDSSVVDSMVEVGAGVLCSVTTSVVEERVLDVVLEGSSVLVSISGSVVVVEAVAVDDSEVMVASVVEGIFEVVDSAVL
jgi:hypothetical protein